MGSYAEKLILEARDAALVERPWYGPILTRFTFVKRETPQPLFHDYMGRIYYNPGYVGVTKTIILRNLLLQIAEMFAHGLQYRVNGRNTQLWSIASLLETASSLQRQGLDLPRESMKPPWFHFAPHKTAEHYYDRLRNLKRIRLPFTVLDKNFQPISVHAEVYIEDGKLKIELDEAALVGQLVDAEEGAGLNYLMDPLLFSGIQEEIYDVAAEFEDRMIGDMPDWLVRKTKPNESVLPWHEYVARFLGESIRAGGNETHTTFLYPSLLSSVLPGTIRLPYYQGYTATCAVVIDTSDSMDRELLARATGELDGLLRALGLREGIVVIPCDAAAHTVQTVFTGADVLLEGGGGTVIGKGLEKAAELNPRPESVVVLTDGYTPWPDECPGNLDVLIVIVSKKWSQPKEKARNPPPTWGKLIEMFPQGNSTA